MAQLVWLLCTNPSAEARILDELRSCSNSTTTTPDDAAAAGDHDTAPARGNNSTIRSCMTTTFDAEDLDSSCVYLSAAVHESLRLYPPAPFTARCAVQGDVLPSGEELPPGMLVLLSLYGMGRTQKTWGSDAAEFKPERWISEEYGGRLRLREESSYKFAVFGAGPRMCVGKSLALATIKAVVASVVYNFRFSVAEGHDVSVRPSLVLNMKNGMKGSLHRRCRSNQPQ